MSRRIRNRLQPIPCKRRGCPGIASWKVTRGKITESLCHEHRNDVVFDSNQQVSEERIRY